MDEKFVGFPAADRELRDDSSRAAVVSAYVWQEQ
jgi:hypothetical protein